MIQFNLLPDVKINYLKARKFKRRVFGASIVLIIISVGLVAFVYAVQLGQKKHISDLTRDIGKEKTAIEAYPDINKVLTIQNQLNQLPDLHDKKPMTSRLFDYINKVTPSDITLSTIELDVASKTIGLTGSAPNLEAVNRFVDTLKFATYKADENTEGKPFTDVTTTLARSSRSSTFDLKIVYDSIIFDRMKTISITVPKMTSTRSETEKPAQLFKNNEGTE